MRFGLYFFVGLMLCGSHFYSDFNKGREVLVYFIFKADVIVRAMVGKLIEYVVYLLFESYYTLIVTYSIVNMTGSWFNDE